MNVLFLPEYPDKEFYTIVAIFMRLGYFATQNPQMPYDFAMSWQDVTWQERSDALELAARTRPVVNLSCRDISKRRVEREFTRVFGYSSFIDPGVVTGRAVKKYDRNASGGFVVQLPTPSDGDDNSDEFVFQKFLDSSQGEYMIEYRVPIVIGRIPVVYTEYKDIPEDHIKTRKQKIELTEVDEVFSATEVAQILKFCRGIGMDFGELDIIRANDDGRIYIIDANKTPGGFGMFNKVNWTRQQRQQAIEMLADAFDTGIREKIRQQ
jgi:hypothetical protein